jgi:hypothetical protein
MHSPPKETTQNTTLDAHKERCTLQVRLLKDKCTTSRETKFERKATNGTNAQLQGCINLKKKLPR